MSRSRVIFRLSMPGRGSWNGRWSGEDRNYIIVRDFGAKTLALLLEGATTQTWTHAWSDGWCATITGRVMERGERAPKSDGFCGYDWMVDNIIRYGSPYVTGTGAGMVPA